VREVNKKKPAAPPAEGARQEVRSLAVGAQVLRVLAAVNGPLPLAELARRSSMPGSKVHRYLAGFISAGLVRQVETTGHYDLGAFALEMGLAALRRLDVVELAGPVMMGLRGRLGETVSLTIWTHNGPTLVRWLDSDAPVSVTIRLGTVLPVTRSSNGLVFAAFLPPAMTEELVRAELDYAKAARSGNGAPTTRCALDALLDIVRANGIGTAANTVLPGISSLSAPVYGVAGALKAALTVVGVDSVFDNGPDGPAAHALRSAAAKLSRLMGHVAEAR